MKSTKKVRNLLKSSISAVASKKSEFCYHPEKDFIRNRKLNFEDTVHFILSLSVHSIPGELRNYFESVSKMPTKSAFIQQRQKIAPEAFRAVFDEFTGSFNLKKTFKGYRLLAVDGTSVNLPRNPADVSTSVRTNPKAESYNTLHINALYDLMNMVYTDYMVDLGVAVHESAALNCMAKKLPDLNKTIFVGDRGFGNLPAIYRLSELKANFVIRCKDITSNGFLTRMVPEGEFDLDISRILTRSRKKEFRSNPEYMIVSGRNSLDFSDNKCYPVSFRACRFQLPSGAYECLITNLPRSKFPVSVLKQIYMLRWGIETSFRDLKYAIGLVYFHARKLNSVLQEIHAALIMMNFCSLVISSIPLKQKSSWKYKHKINFAAAVGCCRSFFSSGKTKTLNPILRDQSLIRPDRHYDRNLHDTKPAKSMTYRVS